MRDFYNTFKKMSRPDSLYPWLSRVVDWNNVARNGRNPTPLETQWSFIEEEFDETIKAARENDPIEVIDGACDLFVVTSYAAFLFLHRHPDRETILRDRTAYTGEDFSLSKLEAAIFGTRSPLEALKQSVGLLYTLDTNIKYNLTEVLDSNDTKYPTMRDLVTLHPGYSMVPLGEGVKAKVLEAEAAAILDRAKGRYKGISSEKVITGSGDVPIARYVFRDSNGKIMKPGTFRKPEIVY